MSVYWIGRTKVLQHDGLAPYAEWVGKAAAIYKPEALVRGGNYRVIEGPDLFDRWAVLKFDSMDHALSYYSSPEYQEALKYRQAATRDSELAFVEGAK